MERVVYEDETTYCVVVGVNNSKVKKVITHIIGPQALPEPAYNKLKNTREQISKSRNIKEFE